MNWLKERAEEIHVTQLRKATALIMLSAMRPVRPELDVPLTPAWLQPLCCYDNTLTHRFVTRGVKAEVTFINKTFPDAVISFWRKGHAPLWFVSSPDLPTPTRHTDLEDTLRRLSAGVSRFAPPVIQSRGFYFQEIGPAWIK